MFEDIIGVEDYYLICCATCTHARKAKWKEIAKCTENKEQCFNQGEITKLKGWRRFNPTYNYSKWKLKTNWYPGMIN